MRMPFGKYEGHEIDDIPLDYLDWLAENCDLYGRLRDEVLDVLSAPEIERIQRQRQREFSRNASSGV